MDFTYGLSSNQLKAVCQVYETAITIVRSQQIKWQWPQVDVCVSLSCGLTCQSTAQITRLRQVWTISRTILHSRLYLHYQGHQFNDHSVIQYFIGTLSAEYLHNGLQTGWSYDVIAAVQLGSFGWRLHRSPKPTSPMRLHDFWHTYVEGQMMKKQVSEALHQFGTIY